MMIKFIFVLTAVGLAFDGYWTLNEAARAILRGNVSRSRYKKILKETSFINKIRLTYILSYAKLYAKDLKIIIFFSKVCFFNFIFVFVLGFVMLILNLETEFYLLLVLMNLGFINLPTTIFMFIKWCPGWTKKQVKGWRYAVDGKEKRRSTSKK